MLEVAKQHANQLNIDDEAFEKFYEENKKMIYFVYNQFGRMDKFASIREDLLDACLWGFMKGYVYFDENRGVKLSTYLIDAMRRNCHYVLRKYDNDVMKEALSLNKKVGKEKSKKKVEVGESIADDFNLEQHVVSERIFSELWDILMEGESEKTKYYAYLHFILGMSKADIARMCNDYHQNVTGRLKSFVNRKKRQFAIEDGDSMETIQQKIYDYKINKEREERLQRERQIKRQQEMEQKAKEREEEWRRKEEEQKREEELRKMGYADVKLTITVCKALEEIVKRVGIHDRNSICAEFAKFLIDNYNRKLTQYAKKWNLYTTKDLLKTIDLYLYKYHNKKPACLQRELQKGA